MHILLIFILVVGRKAKNTITFATIFNCLLILAPALSSVGKLEKCSCESTLDNKVSEEFVNIIIRKCY